MWAKVPDDFADDPRFLALGVDVALGVFLRVAGMCHCAKHLTDGFIHEGVVPRLVYVRGLDNLALAESLVDAGIWERADEGFIDVDYLRWNPTREKYESWRAAGSKASLASWEKRRARRAVASDRQSESLGASQSRTRPVSVPDVVSDPYIVSEGATDLALLEAMMDFFPRANRSEISEIIFSETARENGPTVVREAIERTIRARGVKNPGRYFRRTISSIRRGE